MKVSPPVQSGLLARNVLRSWLRDLDTALFAGAASVSSWALHRDELPDNVCEAANVNAESLNKSAWLRVLGIRPSNSEHNRPVTSSNVSNEPPSPPSQRNTDDTNRYGARPLYTTSNKLSGYGPDLRRFLEEVGTEAKEARYWLKHFHQVVSLDQPFAIVQVEADIFDEPEMLEKLASSLSFLQRHDMKCVVTHGYHFDKDAQMTAAAMQAVRVRLAEDTMMLVSALEAHGAQARPLFAGSGVLHGTVENSEVYVSTVNTDPVKWSLRSGHIPVLQGVGETANGQLVSLDVSQVTAAIAGDMQPRKVLMINTTGGIRDERQEIIANINLPIALSEISKQSWCTEETLQQVNYIAKLLNTLPLHSSVVITCATTLLTELFSHHGSGTFFKNTEPIHMHTSLKDIDIKRLQKLINASFHKKLKEDYFEWLQQRLYKLYLSEEYNAAAIITNEGEMSARYLDKFAVGLSQQGMGTSDLLWGYLQHDFKQLFWRSKGNNRINPWYFKKCDGSWSDGNWIVFWYGMAKHQESSQLIDHALALPDSFRLPENNDGHTRAHAL